MIWINKRQVVYYDGYTYSKNGPTSQYRFCSSKRLKCCPGKITISGDGTVLRVNTPHNHGPPKLYKAGDGQYIRV